MTFALRVYQKAYNKSPLEYWGNGFNKSDIVFLETDDQTLYDNTIPEVLMEMLRGERNQLLTQTDWRMTTDYPYNDQSAWANYRTALRNLPATANPTLDGNGNLIVDWPTPPDAV